jgi:hypothetical protein
VPKIRSASLIIVIKIIACLQIKRKFPKTSFLEVNQEASGWAPKHNVFPVWQMATNGRLMTVVGQQPVGLQVHMLKPYLNASIHSSRIAIISLKITKMQAFNQAAQIQIGQKVGIYSLIKQALSKL